MPRQRKPPHPSTMSPGPQHGDELDPSMDELDEMLDDEFDDEPEEADDDISPAVRREIEALRRENDLMKRSIPPAAPAPRQQVQEEEPDWDKMLFENPKQALEMYGERIATRVETKLRGEYQQEQGTKQFWKEFYDENEDLHPDHDLVESTLQKNLSELADLPVNKAMERLADLTRTRIMGYSRRSDTPKRRKAVTEGANAPSREARPQAASEESNVTSLTSLIKARRAKRRAASAA